MYKSTSCTLFMAMIVRLRQFTNYSKHWLMAKWRRQRRYDDNNNQMNWTEMWIEHAKFRWSAFVQWSQQEQPTAYASQRTSFVFCSSFVLIWNSSNKNAHFIVGNMTHTIPLWHSFQFLDTERVYFIGIDGKYVLFVNTFDFFN